MDRVLHAGFHKTGSTFLQKRIFPYLDGVSYLGAFSLSNAAPLDKGKVMLFSSEASCGYPYPITSEFSLDIFQKNVRVLCINKVILVRRNFYSWVLSLYFQTLNERESWSLESFLKANKENLLTWRQAHEEIYFWCQNKGVEVLVIDYQDLSDKPNDVVARLANFIGCEPVEAPEARDNSSRYGRITVGTYRILNYCSRSRLFYGLLRLASSSPRKVITGRSGELLEKISSRDITARDVEELMT